MESISEDTKNILGLKLVSDPRWVDLAAVSMTEILTDHAWCEQKAATTCISLITRYSSREKLVKELAPIVGGGGGGRPDFAEAGGKDPSKIDELHARAPELLATLLAGA